MNKQDMLELAKRRSAYRKTEQYQKALRKRRAQAAEFCPVDDDVMRVENRF